MAVQSQYASTGILSDATRRNSRAQVGTEDRSLGGIPNAFDLGKFQIPEAMNGSNQYRLFNQWAGGRQGYTPQLDASLLIGAEKQIAANINLLNASRKRPREADDLLTQWQQQQLQHVQQQRHQQQEQQLEQHLEQQQQLIVNVVDFQNNHTGPGSVVNPQSATGVSTGVSTGLRLTFEDDRLRSTSPVCTSGRVEATRNLVSNMAESLGTQIQQEGDEMDELLKIQNKQLKSFLEEKQQRHSRQLMAAAEDRFTRRLREKDLEMEQVTRQNQELMDRFTQLNAESHHWQTKLRNTEAMVNLLRTHLHQARQQQQQQSNAIPVSREQSKEGCWDSDADDCASSYVDDRNDAHLRTFNENKELREQRTCRVCRCNDVSMLLLPCRHLCLCQDCEGQLQACPLCRTLKNGSVQVYMS